MREGQGYLWVLIVLALGSMVFGKLTLAGSNTYVPEDILQEEFACEHADKGWFSRGRCDGGTPTPWLGGIRYPARDGNGANQTRNQEAPGNGGNQECGR